MDQVLRQVLTELRGAWRFRWLAMGTSWAVAVVGIAIVLVLPDIYEVRAQVYVDTRDPLQSTPQRGQVDDAAMKVAYVRRLMLSIPNLEQVARKTDLDLRASTPEAFKALVEDLQTMIIVEAGRGPPGSFETNLYTIYYRDTDRWIAEDVVQVLLSSFQEESLEGDLQDDLKALAFLDNQIDDYRRQLEAAEARVAEFRRRNAGVVGPEGGFFTRLENLQEEIREVRTNLRIALERRDALSAQVGGSGGSTRDGEGSAGGVVELENQVVAAERNLDELRLRYTEEHPSVVTARETLAALQSRLERRREELGPLLGSGAGGAAVENVRIALTQAEIDVTDLSGRERDLRQRIAELQSRVEIAPQLEAELAALNRDHDVLRNQYESLLQRRQLLSFDIDRKRQGRQLEFRIIEPPRALGSPVQPHRFLLMLMVLGGSLAGGGALAFILHKVKPTFVTGDMVYQQLGIPVLGSVSMAWTPQATWARRREELRFTIALVALLGVFGMVFVLLPQLSTLVGRLVT